MNFSFNDRFVLATPRLLLRDFEPADIPAAGPIRDIRGRPVPSKILLLTREAYLRSAGR